MKKTKIGSKKRTMLDSELMESKTLTPVGEWLVARIESLGINRQELAYRANMSKSTLTDIIYGDTQFNAKHARKLSEALGDDGQPLLGISARLLLEVAEEIPPNDSHSNIVVSEASATLSEEDQQRVLDYILLLRRQAMEKAKNEGRQRPGEERGAKKKNR